MSARTKGTATEMAARDYWDRMLVYFGIAEENWQDDQTDARESEPSARRRSASRERSRSAGQQPRSPRQSAGSSGRGPAQHVAGVGVVPPKTFNDAQQIADQFKMGHPVIVNMQATSPELAKRLIDFASGLTYGMDGRMQRIADKVFLLSPADVDVSDEDRAAMAESGFFNQS